MFALSSLLCFLATLALVSGQMTGVPFLKGVVGNNSIAGNSSASTNPAGDGKFTISSEGIRANFVPYGASVSNLFVTDKNGSMRDVILGWDNATYYTLDKQHPYFGAVPGRYANRIKNSSFTVDGETYHVLPNENNGEDTLHGGPAGWSYRNWTVVAHTTDSITFSLADADGNQGFPGEVVAYVTYTVTPNTWHIRMTANSLTKSTPIMLSSHTYWNLDSFDNPATQTIKNHSLYLPYAGQRIATDSILIPNGTIASIPQYDANDFWSAPKDLGANLTTPGQPGPLYGECGVNCTGFDTCFLFSRRSEAAALDWQNSGPVATLASAWSGVRVDVYSDQAAFQIYSCDGQNGTLTLKSTQGTSGDAEVAGRPRTVPQYGCVVMEVEDWIDGINYPEWGRDSKQIWGPGDGPYTLAADYVFSVEGGTKNGDVVAEPLPAGFKYAAMRDRRSR